MINIVNTRDATEDEWDKAWRFCEYGTYFNSREWAEVWQSYTNGTIRAKPKLISFSDQKNVVLPILRQTYYKGMIKRYGLAGPPSLAKVQYGNWLTSDILTDEHIKLLSNYLMESYNNLIWQLNPYDDNSKKVYCKSKHIIRKPFITFIINLTEGEDSVYKNFKQSCRNNIKQALKNKLTVSEATNINHWIKYYQIYQDTIKRWGSKTLYVLDWKLFETLFYKNSPNIKLWLVWYEDIAIAGSINFYANRKIMGWQGASLTSYHTLRPVHLLEYAIIKDGINKNYCWYDLGTAGSHKGLQNFKKSFGPEKKMCDMLITWHPIIYYIKKILNKQ